MECCKLAFRGGKNLLHSRHIMGDTPWA
jgi:hypothetical protein